MLSSIASATAGMTRAADRLESSANRVARFGTGLADVDLATEAVEVTMAQADFKANASVVRVADAMAKATINILA
ncbi:flagellar hook protein FlgE [Devosia sp. FKR38]|uniref:flagellar hook protein FlgE n=1 Tax=Devosia sp. FKR38 TaxID=2562312 RepID=UPI0010C0B8A7|nr:flagellar hook protein FlgE [Devosia sp. FKR38]